MQNIIVLIKQTSIQYPDKVWDTALHFANTLEDRSLQRLSRKNDKEFKYNEKFGAISGEHIPFLGNDKKSLYRAMLTTEELYQYDLKNWFLPHQEKGLISFEELAKYSIDSHLAFVFGNFISYFKRNSTDTKFINKFISKYGVSALIRGAKMYHTKEHSKVKNDNNN